MEQIAQRIQLNMWGKNMFKKQAYPGEAIDKHVLWGGSLGRFPCTVPAISNLYLFQFTLMVALDTRTCMDKPDESK